jgi:hypothetical protein
MRQFSTRSFVFRPIAAVLLAVSLQACTKWSLVPEPKSLATNPRGTVRLTMIGDSKHMVVKNPTVVGDSLTWTSPEPARVPLSKIAWVEARSMDPIATGFFALVGTTFLAVILLRQ